MTSQTTKDSLDYVLSSPEFVELSDCELWKIDLKYAGKDNFMAEDVYKEFNRAFLHRHAAAKLNSAAQNLKSMHRNYKFLIYDVLRPRSVQWKMWNKVKGTEEQQYIANPENGSNHNFGMAIDLTVLDDNSQTLDMGTAFDEFTLCSQPKLEARFIEEGRLTEEHLKNRRLLRECMEKAGFKQLSTEWWHFDALPRAEIRQNYRIVE